MTEPPCEEFGMAPMGRWAWVSTVFLVVLAFGLLAGCLAVAIWNPGHVWVVVVVTGLVWVVLLNVWGYYRPRRFEVRPGKFRIVWPFRRYELPAEAIDGVRELTAEEVGLPIRLLGAGGFFGTFGLCRTPGVGLCRAYLSRREGVVVIERRGMRPLLLTPERPAAFVAALATEMEAARAEKPR